MVPRKAIFLDRDGVINQPVPRGVYVTEDAQFILVPEMESVLRVIKARGFMLIVITNQSQINAGRMSVEKLLEFHRKTQILHGGRIDGLYYCPHLKDDGCICRKPRPGMLHQAIRDHTIDPAQSWFIGDSHTDIVAGQAAGLRTILIEHPYNEAERSLCCPTHMVGNPGEILRILG